MNLTILGSTGSVGTSTLNVVARHPERFKVWALTAARQVDLMFEQCQQFRPERVVMVQSAAAAELRQRLSQAGLSAIEVMDGWAALDEVAGAPEVDAVMAAIVGAAGLRPTLAAARAGSTLSAARELGVNQTTVARRIAALESALGQARASQAEAQAARLVGGQEVLVDATEGVEVHAGRDLGDLLKQVLQEGAGEEVVGLGQDAGELRVVLLHLAHRRVDLAADVGRLGQRQQVVEAGFGREVEHGPDSAHRRLEVPEFHEIAHRLGHLGNGVSGFTIHPKIGAKTFAEFMDYARKNPGKLNFGSSLGTPPQLLSFLFKHKTGLELTYIPYKGSAQSITDMIGGETHMTIDGLITLMPLIREGKLRPLGMARAERWPDLPDVPTMGELGLSDFTVDAWTAVLAPAGTPREIVVKLNTVINEGLGSPETKTALARLNFIAKTTSPEEFSRFLADEVPKWAALVKLAGAKAE